MCKKQRQSNIELLRILAITGVIILHYNNPTIGKGLAYVESGSLNFYICMALQSLFVCSVNLFMLISGYFMCESKSRSLWRPIELLVQVVVFREAIYLLKVILHIEAFSLQKVFTFLIPTNYFVVLYCTIFILSPFINRLIADLSQRNFRHLITIMVLLFSVWPTVVDVLGEVKGEQITGLSTIGMYGSQWGYSVVNFLLMYLIGAYLKKGNSKLAEWKSGKLAGTLLVSVIIILGWARVNDAVGFYTERTAWEYCNPFVIYVAIVVFILFRRIDLGTNKIINTLAEGAFSVFLLHSVFIPYIRIEKFVTGNGFILMLHIFGCAAAIYLICWCVHKLYHLMADPVFKKLKSKYDRFIICIEK